PVVSPRQNLSQHSQRRPVVVVHHHPTHTPSPHALGCHLLLCKRNRQRRHRRYCESASKVPLRVRLIKLLRHRMRRWSLIHPCQFLKPTQDHVPCLRHQILPQRARQVC